MSDAAKCGGCPKCGGEVWVCSASGHDLPETRVVVSREFLEAADALERWLDVWQWHFDSGHTRIDGKAGWYCGRCGSTKDVGHLPTCEFLRDMTKFRTARGSIVGEAKS